MEELNELRKRAELPNALHGCTSDPCGSVVCQTARDRDELLSRLEQAEQAVQRVRELAEEFGKHDYPRGIHRFSVAKRILRALDGEPNE